MQELECQRHNSEAARAGLEQRGKEKEKEHRIEIAQQIESAKTLEKQLSDTKAKLQQELNQVGTILAYGLQVVLLRLIKDHIILTSNFDDLSQFLKTYFFPIICICFKSTLSVFPIYI